MFVIRGVAVLFIRDGLMEHANILNQQHCLFSCPANMQVHNGKNITAKKKKSLTVWTQKVNLLVSVKLIYINHHNIDYQRNVSWHYSLLKILSNCIEFLILTRSARNVSDVSPGTLEMAVIDASSVEEKRRKWRGEKKIIVSCCMIIFSIFNLWSLSNPSRW